MTNDELRITNYELLITIASFPSRICNHFRHRESRKNWRKFDGKLFLWLRKVISMGVI